MKDDRNIVTKLRSPRKVYESMKEELEKKFNYDDVGKSLGLLVNKKQEAYGDSFGKSGEVLRILYPDGVKSDQLDDMLTIVRILDKLFRIATSPDAFSENPWADIGGYSLLGMKRFANKDD